MKIKLTDVITNPTMQEVGSCELCISVQEVSEPEFEFQNEDGETYTVLCYSWDWGHYDEIDTDINAIYLAEFLNRYNFPEGYKLDYHDIQNIIWDFKNERGEVDFNQFMGNEVKDGSI